MPFANIVFPIRLPQTFTYSLGDLEVQPGMRVLAPFGKGSQKKVGIVLSTTSEKPDFKIKPIDSVLDASVLLDPNYLEWLSFGSRYYHTALGEVLDTALPSKLFDPKIVDASKIKTRSKKQKATDPVPLFKLTNAQKEIYELIETNSDLKPQLIWGITGSGKTEIYLHLMEQVLKKGAQALFLVPEIGLTPQILDRFKKHFGEELGIYHSELTENERLLEWFRVRDLKPRIVVGTRSALFLPFANLKMIVMDEEHDGSYKQDDRFRYHARDLAIVRSKIEGAKIILGSATPSLETYQNAMTGKYGLHRLNQRPFETKLAPVQIIDMAAIRRQTQSPPVLAPQMHDAILDRLKKREQTLILLNRRGFARNAFCVFCEEGMQCPNCSVSLVYHRSGQELICHYCDYKTPFPKHCPTCKEPQMTLVGFGTQTLEDELKSFFPKARIERLDRDSTQKKGSLEKILKELRNGKIDILVGTQMLAKGHDFPNVTLVGVLDLETGLGLPDFRSSERTFQLLTQVAGRAGRHSLAGEVLVQTYVPHHATIMCVKEHDTEGFYERELHSRRELNYPPLGKLGLFLFSSHQLSTLEKFMTQLERAVSRSKNIPAQILGPSPSPLEKIRGRHRWQLLMKARTVSDLQQAATLVETWLTENSPSAIRWAVDIDPINLL